MAAGNNDSKIILYDGWWTDKCFSHQSQVKLLGIHSLE